MANLPIDMKKFKKVASDKASTTLQHDDGHKITIAHKPLSPKFRKQLDSLPIHKADGGTVDEPQKTPDAVPEPQSAPPASSQPIVINVGQPNGGAAPTIPSQFINPNPGSVAAQQAPAIQAGKTEPMTYAHEGDRPYGSPDPIESAPTLTNAAPESASKQIMAPPVEQPQAPGPADPYGTQAQMDSFAKGAGEYKAGLAQQAAAQQQQAQQEAAALQKSITAQQTAQTDYQQHYATLDKERQAFQQDIQNQHIDPNHYLSSMDTGSKISTAIGLILGGIGGGLTHQENPAMKFLNEQINRDIGAQQAELGKKETLLSANMRQFGNMRDATDMTRVMQNDIVSQQMKQAAAQAASPQAKANLLQAAGKFDVDNSALMGQMAMRKTLMSQIDKAGSGTDAQTAKYIDMLRIADPKRAEEIEKRYIPNVGIASIPVDQTTRNVITERRVLGDNIQKLEQFQQKYGGTLTGITDPMVRAQGEALAKQVQDQYRRANQQGVFKPAEAEFVNGVIADSPSSLFSKYTKLPAYKAAADINNSNLNAMYSSVGIRNPMGGSQAGYVPSSFKPSSQ